MLKRLRSRLNDETIPMTHTLSRRAFLKAGAAGTIGLGALSSPTAVLAQQKKDISAHIAPELDVSEWIDGKGKKTQAFSITANRGKWIYLKCFQEWCPSCHSIGFPNLQKLVEAFPDDKKVAKAVIQTTFEGFSTNGFSALRKNQLRYNLDLPFGHDPGNNELSRDDLGHYPKTMISYHTRGTPWVVLIDPDGVVVYSDFHIDVDKLIPFLKEKTA